MPGDDYFLSRIKAALPRSLFTGMREEIDAAFYDAHRRASDHSRYDLPERREVLGRERHWCCERAVRRAAELANLPHDTPHTRPAGGRYTIIAAKNFVIGRAKVDSYTEKVKPSKYKRELATLNAFASAKQADLFETAKEVTEGAIFALFIASANRHQPEVPAFLRFAIPNDTLTGWLFNRPVEDVIAAYAEVEKSVEIVPDLARVSIKKRPSAS